MKIGGILLKISQKQETRFIHFLLAVQNGTTEKKLKLKRLNT